MPLQPPGYAEHDYSRAASRHWHCKGPGGSSAGRGALKLSLNLPLVPQFGITGAYRRRGRASNSGRAEPRAASRSAGARLDAGGMLARTLPVLAAVALAAWAAGEAAGGILAAAGFASGRSPTRREPERRRGRMRRLPYRRRAHEAPHRGGVSDVAEGRKTTGAFLRALRVSR